MMHVSMSDSVNAVQDRYARFTPEIPTDPNASAEAAAAAAAREILMRQYLGQKARIDEAFAMTLASVPDGPATGAAVSVSPAAVRPTLVQCSTSAGRRVQVRPAVNWPT